MATNPYVNKVEYGGTTLIDITDTTADDADVAEGKVYYKASGLRSVGTASGGGGDTDPYPVRNDGNHHLWVLIDDLNDPSIVFQMSYTKAGESYVDWGDGSEIEYIISTNRFNLRHNYSSIGVYEIQVVLNGGGAYFYRSPIMSPNSGISYDWSYYRNGGKLLALEVAKGGTAARSGFTSAYPLVNCPNLKKVTFQGGAGWHIYFQNAFYEQKNWGTFSLSEINVLNGDIRFSSNGLRGTAITTFDASKAYLSTTLNGLFQDCNVLREVTLWDTLPTIYARMFSGCTSLRHIDIPTTVTTIMEDGFLNCWSIREITIPAAVTSIEASAFANCYSMGEIHFLPTTPPTVADANAWTNLPTTCVIYVPTGTLADYQAATNYPDPATYTYVEE